MAAVSAIRLATEVDAAAIASIYRPIVESSAISFETEPPDEEAIRRRLDETLPAYPWLVCEIGGVVAGYAYASRHRDRAAYRWSVDTSVYVDESHRRSGVGRGLYTSLFTILVAQGFFNAYAGITLPNPGSVALHEALGFQPIGIYRNVGFKLSAWRDVGWWQLPLQERRDSPEVPLDLMTLQRRPHWSQLLASGLSMIRARGSGGEAV
jgi:L-amino acid N-acyltransferase YncA